jgi:hypothetical protein
MQPSLWEMSYGICRVPTKEGTLVANESKAFENNSTSSRSVCPSAWLNLIPLRLDDLANHADVAMYAAKKEETRLRPSPEMA